MTPSAERMVRFTRGERWIHRSFAGLMGICFATAAILYFGPLSTLVGRRDLVEAVHYFGGLLLPVPLVLGLALSPAFRQDVRRLNRFLPGDWAWLRSRDRRLGGHPSGKFNAGQKLNSAFTLGAVLALLGTGLMLRYFGLVPDDLRTGATLVHDAFAAAAALVTAGHVYMALNDPEAMRGLRTGEVSRTWARREHALWAADAEAGGRPGAAGPRTDSDGAASGT